LQVAINAVASGRVVNEAHIPTPETVLSNLQYDELYPPVFSQPATYIRFSSTVEDCCGCPYNMTEEDDVFLKIMNEKRDPADRCTEDQFEEVMSFFEETVRLKQPYAAVGSAPVLSFAEMQESMDATVEDYVRRLAKDVYDHWKTRRLNNGNQSLLPSLKVSTILCNKACGGWLTWTCSLKPVQRRTIQIHMSAFVGVRSVKSARLAAETLRVQTNCGGSERNWKMLVNWLLWFANENWRERRCWRQSGYSSCNGLK
jgi:hypothetical protein